MELWWSNVTRPNEGTTPVLVHTQTNAMGQFTLDVPAKAVANQSPLPMAVWTAFSGLEVRIAYHRLPRVVLVNDPPLLLTLHSSARTEITVVGPDHNPVANASVIPTRIVDITIPEPLGRLLMATTDATGRAVLVGLALEAIDEVRISSGIRYPGTSPG